MQTQDPLSHFEYEAPSVRFEMEWL